MKGMRILMGATKFEEATAGTIRGDYAFSTGENIIHGSDSVENGEIEIKRFFNNSFQYHEPRFGEHGIFLLFLKQIGEKFVWFHRKRKSKLR